MVGIIGFLVGASGLRVGGVILLGGRGAWVVVVVVVVVAALAVVDLGT